MSVKTSPGGEYLLSQLREVLIAIIDNIARNYDQMTHEQLISHAASLKSNLDIYRLIDDSVNDYETIKYLFSEELKKEQEDQEVE